MIKYIAIYLFSVFISSCAQILLKVSAGEEHESYIREYINWKVIVAYTVLFLASLITIFAYRKVPLSMGVMLESSAYIFVTTLSYLILKERIGRRKMMGMMCILIGIIISCL